MLASVKEEVRYLSEAEDLADARKRFSKIVFRANELIVEKQSDFWSSFVEAYAAVQQKVPHGSDKQALHAELLEEVSTFVEGKDRP